MILMTELSEEEAGQLALFLSTGPVEVYVEDKQLFFKMPGGLMTVTMKLEEIT